MVRGTLERTHWAIAIDMRGPMSNGINEVCVRMPMICLGVIIRVRKCLDKQNCVVSDSNPNNQRLSIEGSRVA